MEQSIEIKGRVLGGSKEIQILPPSTTIRNLYGFQSHIITDHLTVHKCTLTESPTGSGKSTVMLGFAAGKVKAKTKVIIIASKLAINAGFTKYTHGGEFRVGKLRLSFGSVVEASGNKSEKVCSWLCGLSMGVMVCSYQSIRGALNSRDAKVKKALKNTVLLVDEVHHSAIDDNMLGGIIAKALKSCAEVHVFTATAFRADGSSLVNGEFVHYRRTLKKHYEGGYCPDFGVFVRFYQKVGKTKFEGFEGSRRIGSTKALIGGYVDEFCEHRLPTLMLVDTAKQAKRLQNALFAACGKSLNIVNVGSIDGRTYESTHPKRIRGKFARLDSDEQIDVVIAVKVFDEGVDWPDCAQTFSPRVSSSLVLLMQRAIGRAMRQKKRKDHPSPNYSRIVLFEIGIKEDDREIVAGSLFELAVRLKALCEGIDFADEFRLNLPRTAREKVDGEKENAKNVLDMQIRNNIHQELLDAASRGASVEELGELYTELCGEYGVMLSGIAAFEDLVSMKLINSERAARRLNGRLAGLGFNELLGDEAFQRLMGRAVASGAADYVNLLGDVGPMAEVAQLLREHLKSSADKKKEILLQMHKEGKPRPNQHSKNPEERKLAAALGSYTYKYKNTYDTVFDKEIRNRLPVDWFEDTVAENRKILLEMHKAGKPRPHYRTQLGRALRSYTCKNNVCYNPEFDRAIRNPLPIDWFRDTVAENKKILLEMHKAGKPRPNQKSKNPKERQLAQTLCRYTNRKSNLHDSFDEEIRNPLPIDWFKDTATENEKTLLEIAKNGGDRPSKRSKNPKEKQLGIALVNYSRPASKTYRPKFISLLQRLRQDWFEDPTKQMEDWLTRAKAGDPKPATRSKEWYRLLYYCSQYSDFKDEINNTDWALKKMRNIAFFLEWIRRGDPAPEISDCRTGDYEALKRLYLKYSDFRAEVDKAGWDLKLKQRKFVDGEDLLRRARKGEPRPIPGTKEYFSLRSYRSRNAKFRLEIDKTAWTFKNKKTKLIQKQEDFLNQARKGEPRPKYKTREYITLQNYCSRYPDFAAELDKTPWKFKKTQQSKNKEILLDMHKAGKPRPKQNSKNPEERKLACALSNYICKRTASKGHSSYDPVFDKAIRKPIPIDWFKRSKR